MGLDSRKTVFGGLRATQADESGLKLALSETLKTGFLASQPIWKNSLVYKGLKANKVGLLDGWNVQEDTDIINDKKGK